MIVEVWEGDGAFVPSEALELASTLGEGTFAPILQLIHVHQVTLEET